MIGCNECANRGVFGERAVRGSGINASAHNDTAHKDIAAKTSAHNAIMPNYILHLHSNTSMYNIGLVIIRAWKIVTKFHNYSYEIVNRAYLVNMSPVIGNSYPHKNVHNSYQIVK